MIMSWNVRISRSRTRTRLRIGVALLGPGHEVKGDVVEAELCASAA